MIGDIILWFKETFEIARVKSFIRMNIFCIHDYHPMFGTYGGWFKCTKCGREKWKDYDEKY